MAEPPKRQTKRPFSWATFFLIAGIAFVIWLGYMASSILSGG